MFCGYLTWVCWCNVHDKDDKITRIEDNGKAEKILEFQRCEGMMVKDGKGYQKYGEKKLHKSFSENECNGSNVLKDTTKCILKWLNLELKHTLNQHPAKTK